MFHISLTIHFLFHPHSQYFALSPLLLLLLHLCPLPQSYGLNADGSETPQLVTAINEFVKSLAGYSIICYALAIKDRYIIVQYNTS